MATTPPVVNSGESPKSPLGKEHPFALVFAICHVTTMNLLKPVLTPQEFDACDTMSRDVQMKLQQILRGEVEDDRTDTLPSIGFLRHCGTPLANRYTNDLGRAMRVQLGEGRFKEVQKALNYFILSSCHTVPNRQLTAHLGAEMAHTDRSLDFGLAILRVLALKPSGGNFMQVVANGALGGLVHRFSWATGMASIYWLRQYRGKFCMPFPEWVALEHPYIRSRLCQLATDQLMALPPSKPTT